MIPIIMALKGEVESREEANPKNIFQNDWGSVITPKGRIYDKILLFYQQLAFAAELFYMFEQ